MKRIPDGDTVHASRRSFRTFGLHGAWAGAGALVLACAANPADEPTSLATTDVDTGEDDGALEEDGPPATDDGGEAGEGPGAGPGPEAAPCDDYLACLLLTCPECTAGALQLYGEESACWDNETQAMMCEQACDDLLVEMTDACQCADGSCAACTPRLEIRYQPDTPSFSGKEYWLACDDGAQIDAGPWEISVEYVDGREVVIAFESALGSGRLLRGTHPCAGETFQAFGTVEEEGGAYSEHWIATLTPTPNAQTLSMVIVGAFSYASGSMRRCSLSADLHAW
jgi:hypothetical protein